MTVDNKENQLLLSSIEEDIEKVNQEIKELHKDMKEDSQSGYLQSEFVDCGKCQKLHGPYFYFYSWKGGKLHKKYLGKNSEEIQQLRIRLANNKGNKILQKQINKLLKKLIYLEDRKRKVKQGKN